MKTYQSVVAVLFAGLLITGLSACEKEGPAETAGKAIDEAASDVTEEAMEAKEAIDKKLED